MDGVRAHVLEKLYGRRAPARVVGLAAEYEQVYATLEQTCVQKRGYQCMLLGAAATGKTLLVNRALAELEQRHAGEYILVRINGLVHGEDKLALRSIAQQLDATISTGDDSIEDVKMSQTMQNLNSLFERASLGDQPEQHVSVIFVVEEFQKYCQMHQVLAYELLELSQTCPFGVAFVGTSRRTNLVELLEKRNRSRNAALSVHLGKPRSAAELAEIGRALLAVDDEALRTSEPDAVRAWDAFVEGLDVAAVATRVFYTTNSPQHLCAQLLPYVLGVEDLACRDLMAPSTTESLLADFNNVPELEWALLLCAARALVKFNTPTVNLVIVMDEWRAAAAQTHTERYSTSAVTSLETPGQSKASLLLARHAWDRLRRLGLLQPLNVADAHGELKMFVPELDLEDLKTILPRTFSLYSWTEIS